jgi:murein DD-endopeptidase MepM/ murein hydrolase activator NlpD
LEEVYPDGRVRITEANWPTGSGIKERILTPAQYAGVSFVRLENAQTNSYNAPPAKPGQQRQYVVRSGDTLSAIALRELGNANRWTEIKKVDGSTFTAAEAQSIKPGQSIYLPVSYQTGNTQPIASRPVAKPTLIRTGGGDINLNPNFEEAARILPDDGAGTHGSKKFQWWESSKLLVEEAKRQLFYQGANLFEGAGRTNAARHMRHYLNNIGETLKVNVDYMLRDLPDFNKLFETQIVLAKQEANARITAGNQTEPIQFSISSQWDLEKKHYADPKNQGDWYWAIGGFYYRYTALIETSPPLKPSGETTVKMTTQIHVFDRYNWDGGKSVNIGGVKITDEALAELHKVGLAKEYNINGSSSSVTTTWNYPKSSPTNTFPETGDRDGGREDPSRNR